MPRFFQNTLDAFAGGTVQAGARSDIALGHLQEFLVPTVTGNSALNSHISFPPNRFRPPGSKSGWHARWRKTVMGSWLAVGQQAPDSVQVGRVDHGALAEAALALGALLGQDVAQVLAAALELASTVADKTLGSAAVGLHLGHGFLLKSTRAFGRDVYH